MATRARQAVKPKKTCCKSGPRCKRCPVVMKRLAKQGLAERDEEALAPRREISARSSSKPPATRLTLPKHLRRSVVRTSGMPPDPAGPEPRDRPDPRRAARRGARRPAPRCTCPEHDVRRKRPPLLSFLLRMDTLRSARAHRLAAGGRLRGGLRRDLHRAGAQGRGPRRRRRARGRRPDARDRRLRLPRHRPALRAVDLYARRSVRPGLTRIVAVALPGHARRARLRARQRRAVLELLHLLRLAGLRRRSTSAACASSTTAPTGASSAPPATAPRAARRHGRAHRGRRPRARRRAVADQRRRLHLADAAPRQRAALARRRSRTSAASSSATASTR